MSRHTLEIIDRILQECGMPYRKLKMCEMGCMELHEGVTNYKTAKEYYAKKKANHTSIDLTKKFGSLKMDLRKPIQKRRWKNYFDIITDIGTGEHVKNQYMFFKNCHYLCRVGGVMVHRLPAVGHYYKRRIYHYDKQFIDNLVKMGHYKLLMQEMTHLTTFVLIKTKDVPFSLNEWEKRGMGRVIYKDNRLLKVKIEEKTKYYPHTKSTVKEFIRRFPDRKLNIVDIGTRDGYAVELLCKAGYRVLGTELIQEYVAHAKSKERNVIFDDIMDSKLPSNTFDVIYSRHCIEHCRDSLTFFKHARRILKKNGYIFMTFPLESKKKFWARKNAGKNHMIYFEHKNDFRKIIQKTKFTEILFAKSSQFDIRPDKKEVLFIGRLRG